MVNKNLSLQEKQLLDRLSKHFHKPIHRAARILRCSVNFLRKLCRQLGILRWPFKTAQTAKQRKFSFDFNLPTPQDTAKPMVFHYEQIAKPDHMKQTLAQPHRARLLPSFNEFLQHVGLNYYTV
jgi:RWP-RK domain